LTITAPAVAVTALVAGVVVVVVAGVVVPVTLVPGVVVGVVVVLQEDSTIPKISTQVSNNHPIFRFMLYPPLLIWQPVGPR
jgi:branched-subunit amino acid ABC-type transport system permease component